MALYNNLKNGLRRFTKHQASLHLLPIVLAVTFISVGTSVGLWQTYHRLSNQLVETDSSSNAGGITGEYIRPSVGIPLEDNHQSSGTSISMKLVPAYSPASFFSSSDLLKYTNENRIKASLSALKMNTKLNSSAKAKCDDMVAKNYWSHIAPNGVGPLDFIDGAGYSYSRASENLSFGYEDSNAVVAGWMNSPGHKANILYPTWKEVGFGICESQDFATYGPGSLVVQHFGTPR